MSELSAAERDAIIRSMLGSFALDGIDVTYADADRVLAEVEREPLIELYAEIMRGYVRPTAFGALEAYDAALRALYPPPVIITSDRTSPTNEPTPKRTFTTRVRYRYTGRGKPEPYPEEGGL